MKLLLIEDEGGFAQDVRHYLIQHDILCEWTHSVDEAAEKRMLFDYDYILLDLNLSNGNGLDIIHRLKQRRKQEGIIVISANETLESRLESLQAGADDYLTKPFHLAELATLGRLSTKGARPDIDGLFMVTRSG